MNLATRIGRLFRPAGSPRPASPPSPGRAVDFEGKTAGYDGYCIAGWVHAVGAPDRPVEAEAVTPEGQVVGSAWANRPRQDLDGRRWDGPHDGFILALPPGDASGPVQIRVRGTDHLLSPEPVAPTWQAPVALVAADIVNNCNLRCPFCLVDYANIRRLSTMAETCFRQTLDLLPHVAHGSMWLSCLHEPTLHPQFLEFIEMVPGALRNRISFTTNFCKRLSDEILERLAASRVAQVRISFDTDDPELFGTLRVGGRWEVFEDNLLRFRRFLAQNAVRPSLHFITLAFRDNFADLTRLVERAAERYGGDTHELRFIYYFPHVANWGAGHVLSLEQWRELEERFAPAVAAERMVLAGPRSDVWDDFRDKKGLADYVARETSFGGGDDASTAPVAPAAEAAVHMPNEPLRLRLRWDGLTVIEQIPEAVYRVNLGTIASPGRYFVELRNQARLRAS
jgi:molybdenum cofactor biosynthesis enzyme MoaA